MKTIFEFPKQPHLELNIQVSPRRNKEAWFTEKKREKREQREKKNALTTPKRCVQYVFQECNHPSEWFKD